MQVEALGTIDTKDGIFDLYQYLQNTNFKDLK